MGGEKRSDRLDYYFPQGSPPRGRGKDAVEGHASRCIGITPAWAGKSYQQGLERFWSRDHPRVGGEKVTRTRKGGCATGSPPRGRGKD